MDVEKGVITIEKFFLDLIGNVFPGGFLILGILFLVNPSIVYYYALNINVSTATWLVLLAFMYVVGYAVSSLSKVLIYIIKSLKKKNLKFNDQEMAKKMFQKKRIKDLSKDLDISGEDMNSLLDLRDYILSHISPADNYLTRRFRFISLLNIGMATSLCIILIYSFLNYLYEIAYNTYSSGYHLTLRDVTLLFIAVVLFCDRWLEFYIRAIKLPFSVYEKPKL